MTSPISKEVKLGPIKRYNQAPSSLGKLIGLFIKKIFTTVAASDLDKLMASFNA
jgi:hypothetical protein